MFWEIKEEKINFFYTCWTTGPCFSVIWPETQVFPRGLRHPRHDHHLCNQLPKWCWPQGTTGREKTKQNRGWFPLYLPTPEWGHGVRAISSPLLIKQEYFSEFYYMHLLCHLGPSLPLGQSWEIQEKKRKLACIIGHFPKMVFLPNLLVVNFRSFLYFF